MAGRSLAWTAFSLLLFGWTAVGVGSQQRRMPDSPTGRMAGALVALAGNPNDGAFDEFVRDRVSPASSGDLIEILRRFHHEVRDAELRRAQKTGEFSARLELAAAGGGLVSVSFEVESTEPHRLTTFGFELSESGHGSVLPAIETTGANDPSKATDDYFAALAQQDRFSGSLLVARGDAVVYERAFGLAEREASRPNERETKFDVGSITKLMTRVAVARLAEDGKLELDDSIAVHLPDYPNASVAQRVTIRQLLEHRSGLGDIFNDAYERTPKETLLGSRDFFPLFVDEPLLFEPGSSQRYSNAGFIVLGAVIEAAAGQPYDQFVHSRVFEPSGMNDSGFFVRDGSRDDLAVGYTRPDTQGQLVSNLGMLPIRGCSAGSSSHTARDLFLYERALRAGKLLGPEWTAWFFDRGEGAAGEPGFGFGGGGPGVNAVLESEAGLTIVVLANLDPPAAEEAAQRLRAIWGTPTRAVGPAGL